LADYPESIVRIVLEGFEKRRRDMRIELEALEAAVGGLRRRPRLSEKAK
jgi:hypothetical protein